MRGTVPLREHPAPRRARRRLRTVIGHRFKNGCAGDCLREVSTPEAHLAAEACEIAEAVMKVVEPNLPS